MATESFDFDEYWTENGPAPITLVVRGQEYSLPDAPATVIARMLRLERTAARLSAGTINEVPAEVAADLNEYSIEGMARDLAGAETVDAWLAAGVTFQELRSLVRYLYQRYTGEDQDAS